MAEVGIAYTITGPDGTRAVVGNCDAAVSDPDFVGYLDPENGVTGLLDGADVRENTSDLVGADGALHGPFFLSRRSGTIQGLVLPNSDMAAVNHAISKLKLATRALRQDGVLLWTPTGGTQRMLRFRRQTKPGFGGRRPKTFQLSLVSADPYALSTSESSLILIPGVIAGELGIVDPIPDPITSDIAATGQQTIINSGDAPTWPRFRLDGPITNPKILNNTTGESFSLTYKLLAGEYMTIYPERGALLLADSADRSDAYDFPSSNWFLLQPGPNDLRLLAPAYAAGAQLTTYWRDAWE